MERNGETYVIITKVNTFRMLYVPLKFDHYQAKTLVKQRDFPPYPHEEKKERRLNSFFKSITLTAVRRAICLNDLFSEP